MDSKFNFDNTILGEECDVIFNQHMTQRELKKIDSLIYKYADEIENCLGYSADSIRRRAFDETSEAFLMMRFAVLLFEYRKAQAFYNRNRKVYENLQSNSYDRNLNRV